MKYKGTILAILAAVLLVILSVPTNAAQKNYYMSEFHMDLYRTKKGQFYKFYDDGNIGSPKNMLVKLSGKRLGRNWIDLDDPLIEGYKNTNPSVADFTEDKYGDYFVSLKRTGTTNIRYNVANEIEDYDSIYDWHIRIRSYKNPCAHFYFKGKDYAKRFKSKPEYIIPIQLSDRAKNGVIRSRKYLSGKVKVKAAKGWKLIGLCKGNPVDKRRPAVRIKNNSKVNLGKGQYKFLWAVFRNKKTGEYCSTSLSYNYQYEWYA